MPRFYLPTAVSVALGAGFGIALIDTIEALILGRDDIYLPTGAITIIMLIAAVLWFNWRKGEPVTFSHTPKTD